VDFIKKVGLYFLRSKSDKQSFAQIFYNGKFIAIKEVKWFSLTARQPG